MKKYNHGTTILEVLVSIILLSVVVGLMFTLLLNIQKDDEENSLNQNFILNQSSIVKEIEEDIINYNPKRISACNPIDLGVKADTITSTKYICLRIEYDKTITEDNIGYLLIYEHDKDNLANNNSEYVWTARYSRGRHDGCEANQIATDYKFISNKTIYKDYTSTVNLGTPKVTYNANISANANPVLINVPITAYNGRHYDINLSYNYSISSSGNYSVGLMCDNKSLNCICFGDQCESTYPTSDQLEDNKYKFTC